MTARGIVATLIAVGIFLLLAFGVLNYSGHRMCRDATTQEGKNIYCASGQR